MARKLKVRDLTLRDGQQSSFATRMSQAQVNRVLPFYKDANFYAMEVWGGAVPDSVMRYLGENPWTRLESIKAAVGDVSKLTALSRGRNLFGYAPYTDEIIEGFCKNSIESGLGIMRIFDALNDVDNVKATIKYVKKYGGIADCAVCYTIDPKYPTLSLMDRLKGKKNPKPVFTDDYFVDKAKQMVALGADMITIKDMSGLIPPKRVYNLIQKMKKNGVNVPIDFHTHCTPGYGLASVISAIVAGAEVVDTNIWNFAGGPAAPAIELIYVFAKKMGIELDLNFEAIAKINKELFDIRKELCEYDTEKFPNPFNPLTDTLPAEIDAQFDRAIKAANSVDENTLVDACHKIEEYFGFPKPNELVKAAEIPGGMYTNMVAQLKQFKSEDLLGEAMKLIPTVRLAAGLPPLVTPTSQIVGAQAVNCALDLKKGKPMYTTNSNQFVSLVKGEYGKTPVPVDPEFRLKIAGTRVETNYDTSKYQMQPNPALDEFGGVKLAENEKEVLLLELFPMVAKDFLTKQKKARWEANQGKAQPVAAPKAETPKAEAPKAAPAPAAVANAVLSPLPGNIFKILVKEGDMVTAGQDVIVLEAMKMENSIATEFTGRVKRILVKEGDAVAENTALVEIESGDAPAVEAPKATPVAPKAEAPKAAPAPSAAATAVLSPLPGNIYKILVKEGDAVNAGQDVIILEAMKMENSIAAETSGRIARILVKEGDAVAENTPLVEITSGDAPAAEPKAAPVAPKAEAPKAAPAPAAPTAKANAVLAPLPGSVISVNVKVGDKVTVGQDVVVLEAMKMENSISSEFEGTVTKVLVATGDVVAENAVLVEIA